MQVQQKDTCDAKPSGAMLVDRQTGGQNDERMDDRMRDGNKNKLTNSQADS